MIATLPAELRDGLPGARRELVLRMGAITVTVIEVPAHSISAGEWRDTLLARRSYTDMWGGGGTDIVTNDPLDGLETSCYYTRHYLAWVKDGTDLPRLVTMRLVTVAPSTLTERQRAHPDELLPVDIRFWQVRTGDGRSIPLWDALKQHARRLAPDDGLAEFRIATMGRTGTFPYRVYHPTPRRLERTAIAYAAIHLLATYDDPSLLYVCSVCAEFQDMVASVAGVDGVRVRLIHAPSEEMLGLPPGSVRLNNDLRLVREHKIAFPGYFIDNDDAARVLAGMLDDGRVAMEDLAPTIDHVVARERLVGGNPRLLEELAALVGTPDHRRLAELLTRPKLFKYLTPRLASEQPLAGMSAEEFRVALLDATRDGPFSAAMTTAQWSARASAVLEAAMAKYASG